MSIRMMMGRPFVFWAFVALQASTLTATYEDTRAEAERLYAGQNYEQAANIYASLAEDGALTPEQRQWVQFRQADLDWRLAAARGEADITPIRQAREQLQALADALAAKDPTPELWAQAQESLGFSYLRYGQGHDPSAAQTPIRAALGYWADSTDLDTARERYIGIVRRLDQGRQRGYALPPNQPQLYENVLRIAQDNATRAWAHFRLYEQQRYGTPQQHLNAGERLRAIVELGNSTEWYDDALFALAMWNERAGISSYDDAGNLILEPDYEKALEFYDRFLREFDEGESAYARQAVSRREAIRSPQITVQVSHAFQPGSEVEFHIHWRNHEQVTLSIYPLDPSSGLNFEKARDWLAGIALAEKEPLMQMRLSEPARLPYYQVGEKIDLEEPLDPGMYLVVAENAGESARDILLVTDAVAIMKQAQNRTLVYFADALTGAPIEDATVRLWKVVMDGEETLDVELREGLTDADGLLVFESAEDYESDRYLNYNWFLTAQANERVAFAQSRYHYREPEFSDWKIYTYADRPVYRPGEKLQWKSIIRWDTADGYKIPDDYSLTYSIWGPDGKQYDTGSITLNEFGTVWGELELTEEMPLGLYGMSVQAGFGSRLTSYRDQLFRLEEFKLPEFKVAVALGGEDETPIYALGDEVSGTVQVDYYSGGAVPNATVELRITQQPYFPGWGPVRPFGWLYSENEYARGSHYYGGGESQVALSETLQTDSRGQAQFSFQTPLDGQQDFQYRVEARVRDASRREVVASETFKVTRQAYYTYLEPERQLYLQGDRIRLDIRTLNANDQPVTAAGRLRLARQVWKEVWVDRKGREITGSRLENLKRNAGGWFSFGPSPSNYRKISEGYETEEIAVTRLQTDLEGVAEYLFEAQEPGYYKLSWFSRDESGQPIRAETLIWVTDEEVTDIGYRPGQVQIVVDDNAFQAGQRAPVMLTSPIPNRHVLFTVGAEELLSWQVVQMEGTAKLLMLDLGEEHIPNTFLEAQMVNNQELFGDRREIVVPPLRQFLNIDILPDATGYEPQESAQWTLKVTDSDGVAVPNAELSLGVVDEAVYYYSSELAPDIQQFFYGAKNYYRIQTRTTFNEKPFFRPLKDNPDSGGALGRGAVVMERESSGGSLLFGLPEADVMMRRAPDLQVSEPVMEADFSVAEVNESQAFPDIQTRSDFRNTIFWLPDLVTDEKGEVEVDFSFADSLTGWKGTARVITTGTEVGTGEITTTTRLPLIARLQAPRFFTEGDVLTISGVYTNNTRRPLPLEAYLEVGDGLEIVGWIDDTGIVQNGMPRGLIVPSQDSLRVDWQVNAVRENEAVTVKLAGLSGEFSDAMERTYPIFQHGLEQLQTLSGKVRGSDLELEVTLPAERELDSTEFSVNITPSIAVTMLDALPYLIRFPYGCTEQTLSRFVPAVTVQRTLRDLGFDGEQLDNKLFGGIEAAYTDATHTDGKKEWGALQPVIEAGLERLYDFQKDDGSWGWWKDSPGNTYMTAYAVWSLSQALQTGIEVDRERLQEARRYLLRTLVNEEWHPNTQVWMLHALAHSGMHVQGADRFTRFEARAMSNLIRSRETLSPYGLALLTLSAHYYGLQDDARLLAGNLRNSARREPADPQIPGSLGTAYWGDLQRVFWSWSDNAVETTAFALSALLAVEPSSDLVEPAMHWLVRNRRAAQWGSTKETAIAIMALNDYLLVTGEVDTEVDYTLQVNGQDVATQRITHGNLLHAPSLFTVDNALLTDTTNTVTIKRNEGSAPFYYSVSARYVNLQDPIPPASSEMEVQRRYYVLREAPTLLGGYVTQQRPLEPGDTVRSGERIEVVLTLQGSNNLEYLILEDFKPAGFESVRLLSGEPVYARELTEQVTLSPDLSDDELRYTGRQRWLHEELRDRLTAYFIEDLPQGRWEIRYRLRAETPGQVHALPAVGQAMYVPEIRGNSAEDHMEVTETL